MSKYALNAVDVESNGLDPTTHSPVEISIIKLSTDEQRTWFLKPLNVDASSPDALRVNGLKLEDLRGDTREGKEKYREPSKVLVEIENWLAEDLLSSEDRILTGHNVSFDKAMLENLWKRCGAEETFPFNKKYIIDTMQIAFMMDYVQNISSEGYSLFHSLKKYGIKNEQAHSAASDIRATKNLLFKQVNEMKKKMGIK